MNLISMIAISALAALMVMLALTGLQWFDYKRNSALTIPVENRLISRVVALAVGGIVVACIYIAIQFFGPYQ